MKLSIIIVNYNVKYFIEHVLLSIRKAVHQIPTEIFVVDNASVDDSVEMIGKKFPEVKLIVNEKNIGFAAANNQAINKSTGEYILLLNPDTLIQEDTLVKCISFMDTHLNAGGLGVKMLDGSGNYLPESKRGFPSPLVAFCKAFGLTKIFPRSKFFAKYYLGHLKDNEINEVEVLAGAFMLMRKEVLDKIGLLDEIFFMYGEDIDLSYRIIKAGYKNYYFPDTRIIHYKGESTKKGSLNYVKMFYNAMILFARKHFSGSKAAPFILLLQLAIYLRAFITVVVNLFKNIALPLADACLIYVGMILIKNFWEQNIKAEEGVTYSSIYITMVVPVYILIWITSVYFNGGYDKPVKLSRIFRGLILGTIIIAAFYGFLDETLRFSRGMILLGFAYTTVILVSIRWILHFIINKNFDIEGSQAKRIAVVGNKIEATRVKELLKDSSVKVNLLGFISLESEERQEEVLGSFEEIADLVSIYNIDEIIFCSGDIASHNIIDCMIKLGSAIKYKMVPHESMSIIGSHSKELQGQLYTLDIQLNIDSAAQRRNKRVLDFLGSILFLCCAPVLMWVIKKPFSFLENIFTVLIGGKSWVGFTKVNYNKEKLPKLKSGILNPALAFKQQLDESTKQKLNLLYAKDYNIYKDIAIIFKNINKLGG